MIKCETCEREFASKEALNMHSKSKHPEKYKEPKNKLTKYQKRKIRNYIIAILTIFIISYFIFLFVSSEKTTSHSKGPVHWHSRLRVAICNEGVLMPAPAGEHHIGLTLLHTHKDRLIHIEGTVWKPEEITLGKYMEAIGKNFKGDELLDKKNGDLCDNKPGKVRLMVNGIENSELTHYVIKDNEDYELKFE